MADNLKQARKPENLHAGHRQRMLENYLKNGISGFSDVEVLEYLLSYAIPRVNTNEIAHRLLNEFGTLYQVFEAPVELLTKVKGVGPRAACLIQFTAALWNRTEESRFRSERYFRTTDDIGRFLVAKIGYLREERTFMMSLDNSCKLLDFREMTRGSIASVTLPYRMILQTALMVNASSHRRDLYSLSDGYGFHEEGQGIPGAGRHHPGRSFYCDGKNLPFYEEQQHAQPLIAIRFGKRAPVGPFFVR